MSVVDPAGGTMPSLTEMAPLPMTVGEAGELRLMPRAKPAGGGFGYLDCYRPVPVRCSWDQLVQACRDGQALLAWSPDTDQMIAPPLVPGLAQAILEAGHAEARTQLRSALLVAAVVGLLSLLLPYAWVFLPLCAGMVWMSYVQMRRLDALTPDQVLWRLPADEPAAPAVRVPAPHTSAITYALTAVAAAQSIVLGTPWLEGSWDAGRMDEGIAGLIGALLLHDGLISLMISLTALMAFGRRVERDAPGACVPLAFVAGSFAALIAELVLQGSVTGAATAGVMGVAGFCAVLGERHAGHDRPPLKEWLTGTRKDAGAAALALAIGFAMDPVVGFGLLAGVGLGLLAIPRPGKMENTDSSEGSDWMEWLGSGCRGLIWLSGLMAVAGLLIG